MSGLLVILDSWPGQMRTVYGDHERFVQTYFSAFEGRYFTGDGARRDEDGYYWITGRVDDVLNVSGHRLGTAEVESALVAHDAVAEAAVVGFPHEIKGTGIFAYVMAAATHADDDPETLVPELKKALTDLGREDIMVVVGGVIPPQDYDELYAAGASAIFGPGTVIATAAMDLLDKLDGILADD